ncbi:hypothetical protein [Caballeronia cordobensis]|uniref:hypothetical protein n=1 Tax=Caballeronia cordobensis TaxID=1353886 RepID=UPI0006AD5EEC|nr:hypothetical protein [Caballeronia cordobensis]
MRKTLACAAVERPDRDPIAEWLQLTIALREAATSSGEGLDSVFVVQVPLYGAAPTVENVPLSFLSSRDRALNGLESYWLKMSTMRATR